MLSRFSVLYFFFLFVSSILNSCCSFIWFFRKLLLFLSLQFIFRLYSISLIAISTAAAVKGDLRAGMVWMTQPGTYQQYLDNVPYEDRDYSVLHKVAIMVLFSSMGFFGSSCSAAITKNFGALTMSITSTARKATTLFLSFFLFNNVCTVEHVAGIVVFIAALTTKSLRRRNSTKGVTKKRKKRYRRSTHPNERSAVGESVPLATVDLTTDMSNDGMMMLRHRSNSNDDLTTPLVLSGGRPNVVHVV
jgi:UAA transporter family